MLLNITVVKSKEIKLGFFKEILQLVFQIIFICIKLYIKNGTK